MQLEIYSDVVCPWCYIGTRRLEKALAGYAGAGDVSVVYLPFQLDPEAVDIAVPLRAAYVAKFGSEEEADALIDQVSAAAAGEGLELRLDIAQRANTFSAHRVLALALARGGPAMQHEVAERLMAGYFTEGRDLGDHAELAAMAKDAGLDGVDAFLSSDAGVAGLKAALGEGRAQGISSVPTFVFEKRWAVSGAQSPEVLRDIFEQIELAMLGGGGGCCGGDGGGCACGGG